MQQWGGNSKGMIQKTLSKLAPVYDVKSNWNKACDISHVGSCKSRRPFRYPILRCWVFQSLNQQLVHHRIISCCILKLRIKKNRQYWIRAFWVPASPTYGKIVVLWHLVVKKS